MKELHELHELHQLHRSGGSEVAPPAPPVWVAIPDPPDGEVGVEYPAFSYASYVSSPGLPVTFTWVGGPPGLVLAPDGSVTGQPTTQGTYNPVVTATNSEGPTDSPAHSIDIIIRPPTWDPFTLPDGQRGSFYDYDVEQHAQGDVTSTSLHQGTLPAGMSYTAGHVTGTPTESGPVTGLVFRASGPGGDTDSPAKSFTVDPLLPSWGPFTLPAGQATVPYTPYDVEAHASDFDSTELAPSSEALPSGMNYTAGMLGGEPGAGTDGSYNIIFRATNPDGFTDTPGKTLVINPAPGTPPSWDPFTLPVGDEGQAYNYNVEQHANGDYDTLTLHQGTLPLGMSLVGGDLTGSPGESGAFDGLVFRLDGPHGQADTPAMLLEVNPAPPWTNTLTQEDVAGEVGYKRGSQGHLTPDTYSGFDIDELWADAASMWLRASGDVNGDNHLSVDVEGYGSKVVLTRLGPALYSADIVGMDTYLASLPRHRVFIEPSPGRVLLEDGSGNFLLWGTGTAGRVGWG